MNGSSMAGSSADSAVSDSDVSLERDAFLRDLIRHLSGVLQDVVGLDDAAGFISIVGQRMGDSINQQYRRALKIERLSAEQVGFVLADLKQRIQGNFRVEFQDEEKIVLTTTSCPFEDRVEGRPSLCMMTSNVFGTIAAENLGYAKVSLEQTIATGAAGCRVVVYLTDGPSSQVVSGNEYFRSA